MSRESQHVVIAKAAASGVHELSDVDVQRISIVDKGANRKRFFLRKREGADDAVDVRLFSEPIAKADWSAVYCVVAEPGALEEAGLHGDQAIPDRWASEDEIRKACHRFAKNGGAINRMHESLDAFGTMVENAIALADFTVTDPGGVAHTIRKGSWYIAVEPNAEGKAAIEDGTFTGVSIEGGGIRKLVAKADATPQTDPTLDHEALDTHMIGDDGKLTKAALGIAKTAGAALPGLDRKPGKSNWVDEVGGLPSLIDRAARHLHSERGRPISAAIATAVNWAKKMCASGTAFGGKVKVSAKAQAAACKAVDEWEAKKARAKVTKRQSPLGVRWHEIDETPATVDEYLQKMRRKPKKPPTLTTTATPAGSSTSSTGTRSGTVPGLRKPGAQPIKFVQRALKAAGHAPGKVDGWHGPKTNRAIKSFQRANKLKVDGVVGRKTKGALAAKTGRKITGRVGTLRSVKPGRYNRRHKHGKLRPKFRKRGEDLAKTQATFAQRMAERDLDEELPQAMDVLRSTIWSAFYPPMDGTTAKDPSTLIAESLDEFKAWALDLIDRVPVAKVAESIEKAEGQTEVSGSVEHMLTDEERDALDEQSTAIDELTDAVAELPDAIAKAIKGDEADGDKGGEDEADTVEDRLTKVESGIVEITTLVKALGAGTPSPDDNGHGDPARVAKSSGGDPVVASIL